MQLSGEEQRTRMAPGCTARNVGFIGIQIGFILMLISRSFGAPYQSEVIWGGALFLIGGLVLFLGSFLWKRDHIDELDD
jgi:hypothetical protein